MLKLLTVFIVLALIATCEGGSFSAGAGKVEITVPDGTPLGAFNHGARRVPNWPIPIFREYSTFLNPAEGVHDPLYAKALVLDDGNERVCFVTMDLMCSDEPMAFVAHTMAAAQGFSIPYEKVTFTGSHTHSGWGAWMNTLAIQITPTMDVFVPRVQRDIARAVAAAMVEAEKNMKPASFGVGSGLLTNVTRNRRAKISPYVTSTTIDPHMAVLRVDDQNTGEPIATMWNFAIHGTCYGSSNMLASADIMGVANDEIESSIGGVALFLQADAGDTSPASGACDPKPQMSGGVTMGRKAMQIRGSTATMDEGELAASYKQMDMGPAAPDWTLARNMNCTRGGPYDICSICSIVNCTINPPMGQGWIDTTPRLNAVRLSLGDTNNVFVTCPVEPIVEFGWWVRNDTASLGYDTTFFMGYTNSYDMYLCTPNEWSLIPNGYECSLNVWGISESQTFRDGMLQVAKDVLP